MRKAVVAFWGVAACSSVGTDVSKELTASICRIHSLVPHQRTTRSAQKHLVSTSAVVAMPRGNERSVFVCGWPRAGLQFFAEPERKVLKIRTAKCTEGDNVCSSRRRRKACVIEVFCILTR